MLTENNAIWDMNPADQTTPQLIYQSEKRFFREPGSGIYAEDVSQQIPAAHQAESEANVALERASF